MKSRSQDDLDHLPSLSLSPDDMSERQTDRGKKRPDKKRRSSDNADSRHSSSERTSSPWPFGTIILSIAFLALAGGGYLQMQALEQDLNAARAQLSNTASLLSDISGTVSETGETLNRSGDKVRDELNAVNYEIRKLWDLSNKKNRSNIEAQSKRLDGLSKSVDAAEKSLNGSVAKVNANTGGLKKAVSELSVIKKELRAVNADVVAGSAINREQLDDIQKTVDALVARVTKAVSGNQQLTKDVGSQLKDYSEKIKAVDAHRQQINRRLLQLENSVRSLESGGRAGLTLEASPKG